MPFGTAVLRPRETRKGPKTPSQEKVYEGVLLGFVENMKGYRVLHPDQTIHEESFNFCSFSEGNFPRRAARTTRENKEPETEIFYPTRERRMEKIRL